VWTLNQHCCLGAGIMKSRDLMGLLTGTTQEDLDLGIALVHVDGADNPGNLPVRQAAHPYIYATAIRSLRSL
jgi:hypothetical protein